MTDSFVPFEPRPDHRHQYVPTERANGSLRRFAPPYSSSNQVLGSPTQSNPSIGSAGSGRTVTQSSFTPHIEIDQDITPIEALHRPAWYDTVELDSPIQARPVRSIDNTTRMAELERAKNMTVPMQLEADKDLLQGPFTESLSTELQDEADAQGILSSPTDALPHFSFALPQLGAIPALSSFTGSLDPSGFPHPGSTGPSDARRDRENEQSPNDKFNRLDPRDESDIPSGTRLIPSSPRLKRNIEELSDSPLSLEPVMRGLEVSVRRADIAAGLSLGPVPSYILSEGGRRTPALPLARRDGKSLISSTELSALLTDPSKNVLIIDTRPISQFLKTHLSRAVNIAVPNLIMRRCKRNLMTILDTRKERYIGRSEVASPVPKGPIRENEESNLGVMAGGWETIASFVTTMGGRTTWAGFWNLTDSALSNELVVMAEQDDDEMARVVEEMLLEKTHERSFRIRWMEGGWAKGMDMDPNSWTGLFCQGEMSERLDPTTRASNAAPRSGTGSGNSQSNHGSVSSADVSAMHLSVARGLPQLIVPTTHVASSQTTSFKSYPLASEELSATEPYPALFSPNMASVNKARRMLPTPIRIDTFGAGNLPPKTGRKPPALNLQSSNSNLKIPPPLKSASLPSPRSNSETSTRLRSASGNTTFLHPSDRAYLESDDQHSSPLTAIRENVAQSGSVQSFCYSQSACPPSPSTFGGVTRRMNPNQESADFAQQSDTVFRSPINSSTSSSSISSGFNYPPSNTADQHLYDDDDEDELKHAPMTFVVSTILPSFLFLGPEITTEREVQQLLDLGVKRILNVAVECDEGDRLNLQEKFEKYNRLPLRDCVEETGIRKGVEDACKFIDDARLHSAPTYVHCKAGKSRSVTVVLGYLIHANAWTLKASYAYVAERRKGISPNIGFVAELMQYEESELGLKGSTGISTSPDRHTVDNADYEEDSVTRRNGHARESLPPAWGSQNASSASADESVTTPRPLESSHRTELPSRADLAGVGDHRGMNKEVRKNGQYVHSRRAPFNKYTLQPVRRVSKAGLEGLSFFTTAQLSPTDVKPREAVTPSEIPGREGWL